jgi:hypothetical protein
MSSGIDGEFRKRFFARLQATEQFWKLSGYNHMFVKKDFHAGIVHASGISTFSRPDELEQWPEPENPYPYVNCLKEHSVVVGMVEQHIQEQPDPVYVFPVNRYAWGNRIDGPYRHPIGIIRTFTPRTSSDHWIHSWEYLNSGQCFFVSADASWALYTTSSTEPKSLDYLMADIPVLNRLTAAWPDMVDYIYREKPRKQPVRRRRIPDDA